MKPRSLSLALVALFAALAGIAVSIAATRKKHAIVPIQDGKTMDFSSGKLVVTTDPTLKKAGEELEAAAANVTFAPRGNQTTPGK